MAGQKLDSRYERLAGKVRELNDLMALVIIVLLVGFATMFVAVFGMFKDKEAESQATYQNLVDQVHSQSEKLDSINNSLNHTK